MKSSYRGPVILAVIILLFGIFGAAMFGLYDKIPYLDKMFHFLEGLALGWFAFIYFQADFKNISPFKRLLLLVAVASLFSVLWEFIEYGSGFLPSSLGIIHYYLYGGDLADTIWDLVADLSGAFLSTFILIYGRSVSKIQSR